MNKYTILTIIFCISHNAQASEKNNCLFPELKKSVSDEQESTRAFKEDSDEVYYFSIKNQDRIKKCMSFLLLGNSKYIYPYTEQRHWKRLINLQIPGDHEYNNDFIILHYYQARQDLFERSAAYFDRNGTMVAAVQSHYLEKEPDPAHPGVPVDPRAATIVTIRKGYDTPALRHYIWVDTLPSVVVTGFNARQLPIVEIPQP